MRSTIKRNSRYIGRALLIFVLIMTVVNSCGVIPAPVAAMLGAGDKPAIDVDAQVGKTNQIDESLISLKGQVQTADEIQNTTNTNADKIENNTVPWWTLIIAVLTGILVMPIELLRGYRLMKRDTK